MRYKHYAIAITRTCGSGGTSIAKILSDRLQINYYDRELLQLASDESGISEDVFSNVDETRRRSWLYKVSKKVYGGEIIPPESNNFVSDSNLFSFQAKVLKGLIEKESFICIGRCSDFVLSYYPNVISVLIHAPEEFCIRHEMNRSNFTFDKAKEHIAKMDSYRSEYYRYHTGRNWKTPENYDLCLNSDAYGYERCAVAIESLLFGKMEHRLDD